MTRLTTRRARAFVLAVVVMIGVGTATGVFAYWKGVGTGAATTRLDSPKQLSLTPGAADAQLSPGHDSTVSVIATNANPYFVALDSLVLDTGVGTGGFSVDAGHSGCDLSVLHFAQQDNAGAGWTVPPKVASADGTQAIELDGALSMDASAANACQGASFTVHLVAGAS